MEEVTHANVLEVWAQKYEEVLRWLSKIQQKRHSAYYLYCFSKWAGKTPTELLAAKAKDMSVNPPPNEVEKLLDDFVADATEFTNAQHYNISIAVKSFFKHNYRDLAKASGKVDLQKVKPYNALSKDGLRKLWQRALNPRDRALIPFVTSTGIAKETLSNVLWGHLEQDWESKELPCITIESELLKGHGHGKYAGVKQVTFLTPESKRELLIYRDWIQEKLGRKLTAKDHIWLETYKPYEPMSYASSTHIISRLSKNAEVPFSWHDARRWVNTALESIAISPNWARKIRGRKVRGEEAPYSRPAIEQLRAKFADAVPLLEFTSERPTIDLEKRQQTSERIMSKIVDGQPLNDEDRADIKRYGIQIQVRESKGFRPRKRQIDCPDGEQCDEEFEQIPETKLLEYLKDGWKIVKELSNGEVIVKR
jgi:hypothetical protein